MTFNKAIDPNFETIGRHKKLTGYIGQITDESGIVLHSYEYDNYSQAETALNAVVYDLLMDYAERGLVDDLPGIENEPSEPPVWPADNGRAPFCATCGNDGDCPDCEDTDTKQNQPTGWCYVCGAASWDWTAQGPLCPSHHAVLDEFAAA